MGTPIKELTIEGFKSIRKLESFELRNLNILIGANGAGKSNFVEVFRLLHSIADDQLDAYVAKAGGGDGFFFGGPKVTPKIQIRVSLGGFPICFTFEPTADSRIVSTRKSGKEEDQLSATTAFVIPPGVENSQQELFRIMSGWTVYHFHDTSALASMRREQSMQDVAYLRADASNVAAFLLDMQKNHPRHYFIIRDTIRLIAPFFDDFILKERVRGNDKKVALDWQQKGSDFPFQPWHLSDGTIRFIALATALLQPNPPPTMVIDEPELGLHPHALEVLAGLVQKVSTEVQVIISTQSAPLLSQFEPEDVITVSRRDGASTFDRLDKNDLADWLKDYTLGELWQKNVVEAGAGND